MSNKRIIVLVLALLLVVTAGTVYANNIRNPRELDEALKELEIEVAELRAKLEEVKNIEAGADELVRENILIQNFGYWLFEEHGIGEDLGVSKWAFLSKEERLELWEQYKGNSVEHIEAATQRRLDGLLSVEPLKRTYYTFEQWYSFSEEYREEVKQHWFALDYYKHYWEGQGVIFRPNIYEED